ncbi:MAG: hypothetical protein II988_07330 [Clostridia bacterium]|nr:hypothetical protein [Clostridia bacterium]MBQ3597599.1 hypothetical protein [Clostridia bacterium]
MKEKKQQIQQIAEEIFAIKNYDIIKIDGKGYWLDHKACELIAEKIIDLGYLKISDFKKNDKYYELLEKKWDIEDDLENYHEMLNAEIEARHSLEAENKRLNEIIKSYQQPASAHIVKNQRSHGKTLELIKAVEQETLKRFTEYIKGKLSAIYKERVSEKSEGDFKLGASLLLVAQAEVEKAKGEFLNGENNSG